ncbi:hypothetical protein PENSPDRAFT_649745 [Peniophora sp. CONT]|nr:hypothetical protein PENSPDRAFT_649745 [Peniophora sp. CONT]
MRLSYTSHRITDTVLVDDSSRRLYATTSSTFGRTTDVLKFDGSNSSNLASLHFHGWSSDTVAIHGRQRNAREYLTKQCDTQAASLYSLRLWHLSSTLPYYQLSLFSGPEVGRAHSRSLGLLGNKHPAYLEFSDDARVLNDLDELVATFVYVQIRREKNQRSTNAGAAAGASAGV